MSEIEYRAYYNDGHDPDRKAKGNWTGWDSVPSYGRYAGKSPMEAAAMQCSASAAIELRVVAPRWVDGQRYEEQGTSHKPHCVHVASDGRGLLVFRDDSTRYASVQERVNFTEFS